MSPILSLCGALRGFALAVGLTVLPLQVIGAEVMVFAAASTKNALDEVAVEFADETGHDVILSLASSAALARQIEQGAPADIFISANVDWVDWLEERALLVSDERVDLLRNRLVLVAHGQEAPPVTLSSDIDLAGMLVDGPLAMALVRAVPAGIYGKAALDHFGLWDAVAEDVAQTDNVRAALALVSVGEAPLGIVYATDAMADDSVSVVATFPEDTHPPIVYPAAPIVSRQSPAAQAFMTYLQSDKARVIFEAQGFVMAGE